MFRAPKMKTRYFYLNAQVEILVLETATSKVKTTLDENPGK